MSTSLPLDDSSVDFLHELGTSMASADALHEVLARVVDFASALVKCDSCLIYVLEDEKLLLRASKNPHPEVVDSLKLNVGEGITGWVAEHREPVAVSKNASKDPRFQFFHELPEDTYEAFLSVPLSRLATPEPADPQIHAASRRSGCTHRRIAPQLANQLAATIRSGHGALSVRKMRKRATRFGGRFRSWPTWPVESRRSVPIRLFLQLASPVSEKQIAVPCRCFSAAAY